MTPFNRLRRRKPLLRHRYAMDLAAAVALTCLWALASAAEEGPASPGSPASIIAAQIRTQGFACSDPVAAARDQQASRPNITVWILSCGNARYRVRLVPDMAAEVTQLP